MVSYDFAQSAELCCSFILLAELESSMSCHLQIALGCNGSSGFKKTKVILLKLSLLSRDACNS